MSNVNALVLAAMDEEMAEFTKLLDDFSISSIPTPTGQVCHATKGRSSIVLMTTKVGMSACASGLGWVLSKFTPRTIVMIGSCGGLAADSRVGQVMVGSEYMNGGADGTAFGYTRGQVPGQPESFCGDPKIINAVREIASAESGPFADTTIRVGQMLSSDAFVTEANVSDTREAFPAALSADMESHAAAQVAHTFAIPFVAVRGVSDLCGKPDDQAVSFHGKLSDVASAAAKVALQALYDAEVLDLARSSQGPAQRFDKSSLKSAMYLMLAKRHGAEPLPREKVSDRVVSHLQPHLSHLDEETFDRVVGLVSAGHALVNNDSGATLTAKDYDSYRAKLAADFGTGKGGNFAWPPTSQTIIKRFNGYWNDALTAIGLKPHRGRARGGLKFTDKDYIFAVRSYVVDSEHLGKQPSFNGYTTWLKDQGRTGKLPSGAAIRQRFGSWKEALTAASLKPDRLSSATA